MGRNEIVSLLAGIFGSVVSGVIILLIEYRSGYFQPLPPTSSRTRLTISRRWVIAIILGIGIGVAVYRVTQNTLPNAQIDSLQDRSQVLHQSNISGSYQNLTRDTDIWVYIALDKEDRYFVFKALKYGDGDGTWEATDVTIGLPTDYGVTFRLGVLTANQQASAELLKNPIGRDSLPSGTFVFDDIVVIRSRQ